MLQMLGRPDEKDSPKEKDEQKEMARLIKTSTAPVTA
jgi:hypothetical protein